MFIFCMNVGTLFVAFIVFKTLLNQKKIEKKNVNNNFLIKLIIYIYKFIFKIDV